MSSESSRKPVDAQTLDAVEAANEALGALEDRFPGFVMVAVVGIKGRQLGVLSNLEETDETGGMFLWGAGQMMKEAKRERGN